MAAASAPSANPWLQTIAAIIAIGLLFVALFVARHNYRKGRGDRRGARILASLVVGAALAAYEIGGAHVPAMGVEIGRLFSGIGTALWVGGSIWVLYIALEPYVRRFWPSTLISWSRLMSGQWRDPLVGRDVLIGCLFALLIEAVGDSSLIVGPMLGYPLEPAAPARLADIQGVRMVVAGLGQIVFNTLFNALWVIFGLVALRLVFRRVWVTSIVAVGFFLLVTSSGLDERLPWWITLTISLVGVCLILFLVLRFGLLATTTFFFVNFTVGQGVLTLDPGRWFFATSIWTLAAAAAIAVYGFYASRAGEPLLGRRLLD